MLALTLLLAACGDKKDPDVTTDSTKQTTESTSESTSESKTTSSSSGESTGTTTSATETETTLPGGSTELTGKEKHPDFMDVNFSGKTFNFVTQKGWSGGWDTN